MSGVHIFERDGAWSYEVVDEAGGVLDAGDGCGNEVEAAAEAWLRVEAASPVLNEEGP